MGSLSGWDYWWCRYEGCMGVVLIEEDFAGNLGVNLTALDGPEEYAIQEGDEALEFLEKVPRPDQLKSLRAAAKVDPGQLLAAINQAVLDELAKSI